ncbi:MAG: sulfite exporter TauE/SafE family protein [Bacteroides sp.]|nr:sulfite exporter TauE/SafE family protein [Bacillota bacterium]MCM1393594.1 sulfite exporter TauE/SafE family protein [[Eubacterium] siraeum]MCM1454987.1 sulfite exporter TauE/SafE family protein [Bacteroides sp.]
MDLSALTTSIIADGMSKYNRGTAKSKKRTKAFAALAGVFIGIVNGIFGAGGGMLAVPALSYILGFDDRHSHATAIAVILPLCLVSTIVYALRSTFAWSVIIPTVIGVIIGGVLGAILLKKLSNEIISFLFYGLMLFCGLKMLI